LSGNNQVSQVIQQNSAAAQESAASAQEMSSQSAVLENVISQFKLKNQNPRLTP
jgi:methyl-accepting chemotaxis protein